MTKRMEFSLGTTIEHAVDRLIDLAKQHNQIVVGEFNNIELRASKYSKAYELLQYYYDRKTVGNKKDLQTAKSVVVYSDDSILPMGETAVELVTKYRKVGVTGVKAVYALIWERKGVQPDIENGHFYWTDREGTRKRVVELSSDHLQEILKMPDFENSRLTPEVRDAIQRELEVRTNADW